MKIDKEFEELIKEGKSWKNLHSKFLSIALVKKDLLGSLFEKFCFHYFKLHPGICKEYKNVWLSKDVPPQVRNRLGLPFQKKEYGIDLILEGANGKLTAVQCKFRSNQNDKLSWSKDKLANLFAEANLADKFIIFTNSIDVDQHTKGKHKNTFQLISLADLISLPPEFFDALKLPKKIPIKIHLRPREHQSRAIKNVIAGFKKSPRGQLIHPCGAGKTLTALWIAEKLKAKKVLLLVPSLALLRQFKNEWCSAQKDFKEYLCVCSDKDIDDNRDVPIVHTYEISTNVTTDPKTIRKFIRHNQQFRIFATYQSLDVIRKALKNTDLIFDLAISDEAHRTAGSKLSEFGLIHSNQNIPVKRRLYMTATPRIIGEKVRNRYGKEVLKYLADMGDQQIYGPVFDHMSFAEAIKRGILVDYKIIGIGVSNKEINMAIEKRIFADENSTIEEFANNYALEKVMRKYRATHAITFHSRISAARFFQKRHSGLFPKVFSFHVSGKQPTNHRSLILDEFNNSSKAVLTNARCLTEGIDVPAIDCVYFCDPRTSKIDIVQASGRALRHSPVKRKEFGYVVVPIFHKKAEDLNKTIEGSPFRNLVNVIRALADQDERIQEEIAKLFLGKGHRKLHDRKINVDFGSTRLITLSNFKGRLRKALFSQIIDRIKVPWRTYQEAKAFVHALQLKSYSEWREYCSNGLAGKPLKPIDIPSSPTSAYKNEWKGWGEWLGTGTISPRLRVYRSFEAARNFARSLKLKKKDDWSRYWKGQIKKLPPCPPDIPSAPDAVFKESWNGWSDWLGYEAIHPKYRGYKTFLEARRFVHNLKLKNKEEYDQYIRSKTLPGLLLCPSFLMAHPNKIYPQEWKGWRNWLGTGIRHQDVVPYSEASGFAKSLNLKSRTDWIKYIKGGYPGKPVLPPGHHKLPEKPYKSMWKGWGDFLGTGTISPRERKYKPFRVARAFARKLNLKGEAEWRAYCKGLLRGKAKKPDMIPANPNTVYKDAGWKGMGDWLGTGNIAPSRKEFRSFKKARKFVRALGLKNQSEWNLFCTGHLPNQTKKPQDIPSNPQVSYKTKDWKGMGDWLGTGNLGPGKRTWVSYEKARKFAKRLKLTSADQWRKYVKGYFKHLKKKPPNIPSSVEKIYSKVWKDWADFLGTRNVASRNRTYRSFFDAREFVRSLGIKSRSEWLLYCQGKIRNLGTKPFDIPTKPERVYGKVWRGVGDWLGTGIIAPQLRKFRAFQDAKKFVHGLKLRTGKEWRSYCRGHLKFHPPKPPDIPSYPNEVYQSAWKGMKDWLHER